MKAVTYSNLLQNLQQKRADHDRCDIPVDLADFHLICVRKRIMMDGT